VLGSFGCNEIVNYASFINQSNYLILLDKLGLIKLIPKDLYELFVGNELSSAIEIQGYSHDLVHELKKIQKHFQYDDLLSFFRLAQLVKGEELSFQKILDTEIIALKRQHPSRLCNCIWGINKRGELVNCLPGELKYFGDFMCPYEFAANELYDKWLNLMPDINFLPFDVFDKYAVLAQRAKFSETASVVGYSLGERIPIFKYNWSEQITFLFDTILQKIVSAHIDELKCWLLSIEKGSSPENRERFHPNIFLAQNENEGLQLISWPAGRETKHINQWRLI
jgi:hypothetical protein